MVARPVKMFVVGSGSEGGSREYAGVVKLTWDSFTTRFKNRADEYGDYGGTEYKPAERAAVGSFASRPRTGPAEDFLV